MNTLLLLCATLVLALAPTAISAANNCASIAKGQKCKNAGCTWDFKTGAAKRKSCLVSTVQDGDAAKCAALNKKQRKCKKQLGCRWTFKGSADRKSCVSVAAPTSTPLAITAPSTAGPQYEWKELEGCCRVGRNDPEKEKKIFKDVSAVEAETMCFAECTNDDNCTAYEFIAKRANNRKGKPARNQCEIHRAKISSASRKNKSCKKAKCFVKGRNPFPPLNDTVFKDAIEDCLDTNPVDGDCANQTYGSMEFWNVGSITRFSSAFRSYDLFNAVITAWDTSAGTTFTNMFRDAGAFNQPLNGWDTGASNSFSFMFSGAAAFNQELNAWVTGAATSFMYMFSGAAAFDQELNAWDTGAGTTFDSMFKDAVAFNQDLELWSETCIAGVCTDTSNGWDTSAATTFANMFSGASANTCTADSTDGIVCL